MRLAGGRRLYTDQCGIRAKWPPGRCTVHSALYLEMICPEAIQDRGLYNLSPEYVEKCLELDQSIETKRSKWGKTPVCFYTVLVGIILAIAGKKERITYAMEKFMI